jgi:hypothetical protein
MAARLPAWLVQAERGAFDQALNGNETIPE